MDKGKGKRSINKMEITERIAISGELNLGLEMLKEAAVWLKEKNINYWKSWLNPNQDYINWIKSGLDNNEFYFLESENEVIGMYRLQYSDEMFWGKREEKAGYIHSFTIKRKYCGQGIGRDALELIALKLKQNGIGLIRLDCGSEIKGLCEYYEKNGFNKVDEREVFEFMASFYEKRL